jgi:hypothetical protein
VAEKAPGVLNESAGDADQFAVFKRTQVQLIKSGAVLRAAVRQPKIAELSVVRRYGDNAVNWLRQELVIDYPDDAEVMRVSLAGDQPEQVVQIVDAVVKSYLSEVVDRARDERLTQEGRLEKKYVDIVTEFTRQSEALHKMEQLARNDSSEAAEIRRKLALENLDEAVSTRNYLKRQLLENELKINLLKAKSGTTPETKTADTGGFGEGDDAADGGITVQVLEKHREFLEARIAEANADILEATQQFEQLEHFSATVTAKQQEQAALNQIMMQLKSELDRTQIERLASDRVTKLDDASITSVYGDRGRRAAGLAIAGAVSLCLIAGGLAAGRRPPTTIATP